MVTIEKKNIKGLITTIKGIIPANYDSMDKIVFCVQYLEAVLKNAEEKKPEEVTDDG